MTYICVTKLAIIGSDDGLSPGRREAIILTIAGIMFFEPLETNFREILSEIHMFVWKIRLKLSPGNKRIFCLELSVLNYIQHRIHLLRFMQPEPCACFLTALNYNILSKQDNKIMSPFGVLVYLVATWAPCANWQVPNLYSTCICVQRFRSIFMLLYHTHTHTHTHIYTYIYIYIYIYI